MFLHPHHNTTIIIFFNTPPFLLQACKFVYQLFHTSHHITLPSYHHPHTPHSASHLVTVPPGPLLSDTLMTSPILVGEDGQVCVGFLWGCDFNLLEINSLV